MRLSKLRDEAGFKAFLYSQYKSTARIDQIYFYVPVSAPLKLITRLRQNQFSRIVVGFFSHQLVAGFRAAKSQNQS